MHIWIDIDNVKHIPLLCAIVIELKERAHLVTLTSTSSNEAKRLLQNLNLNVHRIGNTFSFFGFFEEQSILVRSSELTEYIKNRNVNVAFSLGSKSMAYTSTNLNLPIIILVEDINEKINWVYFTFDKCYFIIPDSVSEQPLIEKGFDIKKIAKYKGFIQKDETNPNLKIVKDIVNQIEKLSSYQNLTA